MSEASVFWDTQVHPFGSARAAIALTKPFSDIRPKRCERAHFMASLLTGITSSRSGKGGVISIAASRFNVLARLSGETTEEGHRHLATAR